MALKYFNTLNCVSTPVNPTSRLPMPSYERTISSHQGAKGGSAAGGGRSKNLYRNEAISPSESHPYREDEEAEDDMEAAIEDAGTIPPSSVSPFEMDTTFLHQQHRHVMEDVYGSCGSFDKDFYTELTRLKQQNIGEFEAIFYVAHTFSLFVMIFITLP